MLDLSPLDRARDSSFRFVALRASSRDRVTLPDRDLFWRTHAAGAHAFRTIDRARATRALADLIIMGGDMVALAAGRRLFVPVTDAEGRSPLASAPRLGRHQPLTYALVGAPAPAAHFERTIRTRGYGRCTAWFVPDRGPGPGPRPKTATDLLPERLLASPAIVPLLRERDVQALFSIFAPAKLPPEILQALPGRCFNMHPGPLPQYAGMNVTQWAIRRGARSFGVTVHLLETVIDGGRVVAESRFPTSPRETGLSLHSRCIVEGIELAALVLEHLASGNAFAPRQQDMSRRTLYRRSDSLDGRIDLGWPGARIEHFLRAADFRPFPPQSYVPWLPHDALSETHILSADFSLSSDTSRFSPGAFMGIEGRGPRFRCGDGCVTITGFAEASGPTGERRATPFMSRLHPGMVLPVNFRRDLDGPVRSRSPVASWLP